jgi:shikimate kinase
MDGSDIQPERNLVLVGFMATGKSTIGRRCAQALHFSFHDTDSVVERRAGKSIREIFEQDGEDRFRALESDAVRDLARERRSVIATGGGVVLNTANVARLRRTGVIVLLWADPQEILARCGTRASRPLLADAADPASRICDLLAAREPYYRAAANAVVETTGLTRDESAERVLEVYHRLCPPRRPRRTPETA